MSNPAHGGKRANTPKQVREGDKAKFVNANLTDAERVACKAWLVKDGELDNALLKFLEDGYRVSVKYDDFSHAYASFCTTGEEKTGNVGFILAGRGSTPLKAIKQALYAHYGKFDGQWSEHYQQRTPDELDD